MTAATKNIKKGQAVKVNVETCFTTENGGTLRFPLTNFLNDEAGLVEGFARLTAQEREEWYNTPHGPNCAGELTTCPEEFAVGVHKDEQLTVVKARVKGGKVIVARMVEGKVQHVTMRRECITAC